MGAPAPDELAQLRAELATQRREIARLARRRRLPRRVLPLLLVALFVALVPLATLAAQPFGDLNPGSPHNGSIDLIYNAGITKGCDPDVAYCPNDLVTREEMATFLARTAGLGDNPPVTNARTAQSAVTAQTADNAINAQSATTAESAANAQNAANAAQLGGQPPSYYHPAGQPIANATNAGNANSLQGFAPSDLLRVAGNADSTGATIMITGDVVTLPRTPLIAVTINVPGPGYVLANGSSMLNALGSRCDGSDRGQTCVTGLRLRCAETNAASIDFATTVNTHDGGNSYDSISPVHLFTIPAAGSYTFHLEARIAFGYAGQVAATNPTITALFVPFGATGTTP